MDRTEIINKYVKKTTHLRKPKSQTGYKKNNKSSVVAALVIKQSLICILILLGVAFLKSRNDEVPEKIISGIKHYVVESNINTSDLFQKLNDQYSNYLNYLKDDS